MVTRELNNNVKESSYSLSVSIEDGNIGQANSRVVRLKRVTYSEIPFQHMRLHS